MVFVVISHVESDAVQDSVVRVGFVSFAEHVVLGDEVASHGMRPHGHQRSSHHVHQGLGSASVEHKSVEAELNKNIEDFELVWGFGVGDHRSEGVEERLQNHPNELRERIVKELGLQVSWDVRVKDLVSLILRKTDK